AAREKIYTAMVEKYPEDWRGFNDLGAVQLQLGKEAEGIANLEKANTLSPENPSVWVNMGNVALMKQDYAKAEEIFSKASAKGMDVSYGMGVLAIRKGNYGEAVSQLNK